MKVFPTFLLLGSAWTCHAWHSPSDSWEWLQDYHGAEEGPSSYTSSSHDQIPEHESSDFSVWQKLRDIENDGTSNWQQHLGPDSPSNIAIFDSSDSEPDQSFGLPIFCLCKNFLKETGALIEHDSTSEAVSESPFDSLGEGQAMVVKQDTEFWSFCSSFRSIVKPQPETGPSSLAERMGYFIDNRNIWLKFWGKRTGIDLQQYVDQIKFKPMKQTFPLFLFYIEVITMILPKIKMEGLEARCEWYIELANKMYKPPDRKREPMLYAQVQFLARMDTRSNKRLAALPKAFVSAWAKKYRPGILANPDARSRNEFELPLGITVFLNLLFTHSIFQLTKECYD
ncbi:hypothetical protein PCANC_13105 [Puccinia coronata f. sp. avenae]|uniref:Uncharacterized protein n=1 Tax=Puccinia coronata f. sp. avenae TaxID=200324 RepID=A0A2N5UV39_9BASI|nr:hypothetical protein PCANC_13105 [Puccinia coronata f. sp. avenae]PLW50134.1 hypothetical protein PCASD_01800 [Puccinia coronata f. sp. avenae]